MNKQRTLEFHLFDSLEEIVLDIIAQNAIDQLGLKHGQMLSFQMCQILVHLFLSLNQNPNLTENQTAKIQRQKTIIDYESFFRNLLKDLPKLRADIKDEFDKFDKATDGVLNIDKEIKPFMDKMVERLSLPLCPSDDVVNGVA